MKVFEYAKQLGMETMALMDKLREFQIPVKSHMADLDDETLALIQTKFAEQKSAKAPAKSTKTKKAAKPAAAATVVKATKPKAAEKPVAKAAKPAAKAASPASAASGAQGATVIRRKAGIPEPVAPTPASTAKRVETSQGLSSQASSGKTTSEKIKEEIARNMALLREENAKTGAGPATETQPPPMRSAQVVGRVELPKRPGELSESEQVAKARAEAASAGQKYDRDTMEKLIRQEALARKAIQPPGRETKVETFIASDFKKRQLIYQPKKKKVLTGRAALKTQITTPSAAKKKIKVEGGTVLSDLAQKMGVKASTIIKQLMDMGTALKINDFVDFDTAQIIANEHGFEVENIELNTEQVLATQHKADPKNLKPRPPIVTVMGHVDHGKTSLLDSIRTTKVAAGEAGGITQHIGAYSVPVGNKRITFLDTPGHEAFTAMRARGAKVTDIVILVVAADDGIMPQTREAIVHAKSAGVPIIVAVNKMDLPSANPQKVMQSLTEFELVPEEWGGTTIIAKVSATKKQGIQELLEMILLQADVLDLKADPTAPGSGTIIEARLDKGRGPVATLVVQKGTIKVGDFIVAGTNQGKIRAMLDDTGAPVKEAGPGAPVEVIGFSGVPGAGDIFDVCESEDMARQICEKRIEKERVKAQQPQQMKMSLEDLFAKVQVSDLKELGILIKADVQGSAEALKESLAKLSDDKVKLKILASAVGGITESDVLLASASKGIVIGFNVRPETGVPAIAAREGVQIKTYNIIYDVVEDMKKAMKGMLEPEFVDKQLGRAQIRELFSVPKIGTIAGCSVIDGKITRSSSVRLLRDSRIIYEGKLSSLKRFKDDVREVQTGFECGIGIENYNDMKVGDVIEAFVKEQVQELGAQQ